MQIQCTESSELKSYTPKKDYKWRNALFLWLGCFRLNAALLIHFNDIILENKNMHGISSIFRKEELFPFANLAIISLICSQFFYLKDYINN